MSFSPEWLALREPVDHASVNSQVREALRRHFTRHTSIRVVDLGCGTGSNVRGTAGALGRRQTWTLVDYDPKLLKAAAFRLESLDRGLRTKSGVRFAVDEAEITVSFLEANLASGVATGGGFAPVISGADLVTAAALFDLFSVAAITQLADAVAANRQAFFTVLTYDGLASWQPEHPADQAMRDAFNQHQQTDKGFGAAAGPMATAALVAAFQRHGYRIIRGKSPWVVDSAHAELRRQLDAGFASAVTETGKVAAETVQSWHAHRQAATDAVTIIGHEDLLALPPG
jgi:SAM-dependent methyltransferase